MEENTLAREGIMRDMETRERKYWISQRIASSLMAFRSANTWDPFRNMNDAWMIANKFKFSVFPSGMGGWTARPNGSLNYYHGDTACEAICQAALSLIQNDQN